MQLGILLTYIALVGSVDVFLGNIVVMTLRLMNVKIDFNSYIHSENMTTYLLFYVKL